MFLDEELLEIGRNADINTKEGVIEAIRKMLSLCFKNLSDNVGKNTTDIEIIKTNFKRINNTWKMVSEKLELEGKGFIKLDGFKIFVESEEFKGIFFK
jgi:hypothetical protein